MSVTPSSPAASTVPSCPRGDGGDVAPRYTMGTQRWFRCSACGIEYPESAVFPPVPGPDVDELLRSLGL